MQIKSAMILAAGLGTRLKPLTNIIPKPMIPIGKEPIILETLSKLYSSGIYDFVVNLHHLGHQIKNAVDKSSFKGHITFQEEPVLLDSGGSVQEALRHLEEVFLVANADIWWREETISPVDVLKSKWDQTKMDALLLLKPCQQFIGYNGAGDYFYSDSGMLVHKGEKKAAPYVYSGICLMSSRAFKQHPNPPFSLKKIWDMLESQQKLYGTLYPDPCGDIGTLDALQIIRQFAHG